MKFIHSADFHLGMKFEKSSIPQSMSKIRRQRIWTSVEKLIKYSIDENVDYIFLSGDLYNMENFSLSDMNRLMDLFSRTNSQICIIGGNHDPIYNDNLWDMVNISDNLNIFKKDTLEKIEFDDTDVYGISYNKNNYDFINIFDDLKLDKLKTNVLMIHSDLLNDNNCYMFFDQGKVNNLGFDYVALGHIHKPTIFNDKFVYPGSIEPLSFKEKGMHGAVIGSIVDNRLDIDFLDCSESNFNEFDYNISDKFSYYDLVGSLSKCLVEDKKNYIRINLKGQLEEGFDLDIDSLQESLKKYCEYVEIIDNTESNINLDKIYEFNRNNVLGYFIEETKNLDKEDPVVKRAINLGIKSLMENNL